MEELQPERQLSQLLFQILRVRTPPNDEDRQPLPGLAITEQESEDLGSASRHHADPQRRGRRAAEGLLYYSTALFDATTIERLWSHLEALIAGVVATPEARLWELPGLAEAEREVLLRRTRRRRG